LWLMELLFKDILVFIIVLEFRIVKVFVKGHHPLK
jgi:hypothetical protein